MPTRTARVRGATPPGYDDEWEMRTVARRTTNDDATATCAVTEESILLNAPHWYVTTRKPNTHPWRPDEYEHLLMAIDALEELADIVEHDEE